MEGDGFYYHAKAGSLSWIQPITLSNSKNTIKGHFHLCKWVNYIPFRHLFGAVNLRRAFHVYKNKQKYGSIFFSHDGFLKSCYLIVLDNQDVLSCYCRSVGSFNYVSVYLNDEQIALVETYLTVNDFKYTHKLYILDSYADLAEMLSFFVVYYANHVFAKRLHMSSGTFYGKSWSFSANNHRYDPTWRETHFPDENFFGTTNLFTG